MNILYLCDEYPPGRHGGIGTAVQLLARQMAVMGHTVVVAGFYDWGYGGDDEFTDQGVRVFRFRRGLDTSFFKNKEALPVRAAYKLFTLTGIFEADIKKSIAKYKVFVESLISRFAIDLIEAPDFNEYLLYCRHYVPFPRFSVPTIVKLHTSLSLLLNEGGMPVPKHFYDMDKHTLEQADALVSVSNFIAKRTAHFFSYNKTIQTLYNGIDIGSAPATSKEKDTVIFAGSLVKNKGIYQLIKAWEIVSKAIPGASLLVIGKGNAAKIKKGFSAAQLSSVHFLGQMQREELLKKMSSASVAVFPSFFESFGLTTIEAMACGTAVIYSNRTTGPELIDDGVDGLLIDPNDVQGIADKIIYLLSHPDFAAEMATKAKSAAKRFDLKVIAQAHIAYYSQLLNSYRNQ